MLVLVLVMAVVVTVVMVLVMAAGRMFMLVFFCPVGCLC